MPLDDTTDKNSGGGGGGGGDDDAELNRIVCILSDFLREKLRDPPRAIRVVQKLSAVLIVANMTVVTRENSRDYEDYDECKKDIMGKFIDGLNSEVDRLSKLFVTEFLSQMLRDQKTDQMKAVDIIREGLARRKKD